MQRLIALLESKLGSNWRDVIDWLRERNDLASIEARLIGGDISGVLSEVESAASRFAADTHHAFVTAGQASAEWLDTKVDSLVRFDQVNHRAVARAQANQYELIQGLVQEQRETIRGVITDGMRAGTNPREMARDIRSSIGLTPTQSSAVQNYRRALESGDWSKAMGYELRDGRADRSMRPGMDLTPDRIDSLTERYRTNFVAHRAEVIARTEALRAAHEGSAESIRQAIERGDIEADQIVTTWNAGPNTKYARKNHQKLDGVSVKYGETFDMGDGKRMMHPGDPAGGAENTAQCRCSASTTLLPSRDVGHEQPREEAPVRQPPPVAPPVQQPAPAPAAVPRASVPVPASSQRAAAVDALSAEAPTSIARTSQGGINASYWLTLDGSGTQTGRGLWKPAAGEFDDPTWNMLPGTTHVREAAASDVAALLGVDDLVPATIVRTLSGDQLAAVEELGASGVGSLQEAIDAVAPTKGTRFQRDDSERMRVFDYVTGQGDRHEFNVLARNSDGKITPVLIDNGRSFPLGTPVQFIQPSGFVTAEVGPLLPGTLQQIEAIDMDKFAQQMHKSGIEREAAQAALYRAQAIKNNPAMLEAGSSGPDNMHWNSTIDTDGLLSAAQERSIRVILARLYK